MATEILKPLSLFSDLRNCHIRPSRTPSPQLQQMAHNMVLKTRGLALPNGAEKTSITGAPMGSRLLTLPRQLRFRILSYTDLITPWKQVEWSRDCNHNGKYLAFYPSCGVLDGLRCESRIHHGCQFLNCWPAHNQLSKAGIGCFCRVRHSAASSTCVCWTPPTALFLVSRSQKVLNSSPSTSYCIHRLSQISFDFPPPPQPCSREDFYIIVSFSTS
jgi:hypothetical protein